MKKAAIAGLVVALGAIWTGTAWYTGQKAEAFVKQSIEDGNVELRKLGEKWGVTREAVRQMESRLMKKLKDQMQRAE